MSKNAMPWLLACLSHIKKLIITVATCKGRTVQMGSTNETRVNAEENSSSPQWPPAKAGQRTVHMEHEQMLKRLVVHHGGYHEKAK